MNKWHVKSPRFPELDKDIVEIYGKAGGAYLYNRGITDTAGAAAENDGFLLHPPLKMQDMDKAVRLIAEAVDRADKIVVFGDSDCDGVTATAIMRNYLYNIGANVDYMVLPRSEGYGLTIPACEKLIKAQARLVITVDTGISAVEEAEFITSHDIKLIITDHHIPAGELPKADAVVNPKRDGSEYPYKELAGCGVALKVVCAVEQGLNGGTECIEAILDEFAPLAAFGTLADSMPLTDENRAIVKYGLNAAYNSDNFGIQALLTVCKLKNEKDTDGVVTADDVKYAIAPRINCGGRYDIPEKSAELFITEDENAANLIARELSAYNDRRRTDETAVVTEARALLRPCGEVYIAYFGDCEERKGVMGAAASRLSAETGLPVMLLYNSCGAVTLSARCPEGMNIRRVLEATSEELTRYGGHERAAGGTLKGDTPDSFYAALQKTATAGEPGTTTLKEIQAECPLPPEALTPGDIRKMRNAEPFCDGTPRFLLCGCTVKNKYPVKNGKYVSVFVQHQNEQLRLVSFIHTYNDFWYKPGDTADIIVECGYSDRNGVSISVRDIRLSGIGGDYETRYINGERAYADFKLGIPFEQRLLPRVTPSEAHFAEVNSILRSAAGNTLYTDEILQRLYLRGLNVCLVSLILDIFEECGVIRRGGRAAVLTGDYRAEELRASRTFRAVAGR